MKIIAYYRRSTDNRQKHSIERQASIVERFVENNELEITKTFIETASGSDAHREQLKAAIAYSRKYKMPICVSSISRLSRDVAFGAALLQDKSVQFIITDLGINADGFMLNVLLCVAAKEREMISQRTKDALAVVKRTKKLGNPQWKEEHCLPAAWKAARQKGKATAERYMPLIELVRKSGVTSYRGIARELNKFDVKSPTGKTISDKFVRSCCLR